MTGRKSEFTQDMADIICERMVEGESLRSICRDPDMPVISTVMKWLSTFPEFSAQYARAQEARADTFVEQMQEIADNGSNDWMEKHGQDSTGWQLNGEHIQRSKLRVDTLKWIASKMKPRSYGDKQQVELSGSIETTTKEQRDAAVAAATRADR